MGWVALRPQRAAGLEPAGEASGRSRGIIRLFVLIGPCQLQTGSTLIEMVALRTNQPAFSGRSRGQAARLSPSWRRSVRHYWSQRDQFHHVLDASALDQRAKANRLSSALLCRPIGFKNGQSVEKSRLDKALAPDSDCRSDDYGDKPQPTPSLTYMLGG